MAEIIDGKALSMQIKDRLRLINTEFIEKYGRKIKLAVVLVGENPASKVYVRNKIKAAEYIGIESLSFCMPEDVCENDVLKLIKTLADDNSVDGILVQLPLPAHISEEKVMDMIPVEKDVDGFSDRNVGRLTLGKECIAACTPEGIIELLKSKNIPLAGKNAVVIGRSNIVGKPVALLLLRENCTVTVCHSKTVGLKDICKNADILVAAIGKPEFINAGMVKEGAVIIDVGINRTENGLKGDVDFMSVKDKASYITPVPGGVGPMTIAMLMRNTIDCAERRECRNGI